MAPLKTGVCATCSTDKVKLRPSPFNQTEQCEDCRTSEIIGITDIKKTYGLKDEDLKDLHMVTEPQLAFIGGPDRRWYLVKEVEARSEEVKAAKEAEREEKKQKAEAQDDEAPKRDRGRPKKGEVFAPKVTKARASTAAPKKAAPLKRKRATKTEESEEAGENGGGDGAEEHAGITEAAEKTKPKPRVTQAKAVAKPKADAADGAPVAKKGRGRPRKNATPSES